MNAVMTAKIEACLELCEGKSGKAKANDFMKKVMKVTGLTKSGFNETALCSISYARLGEGDDQMQIARELF